MNFLSKILNKNTLPKIERNFNHNYFKENQYNNAIKNNGYIKIQNVVPNDILTFLENTYTTLTQFEDFSINENFQNSGRYASPKIRAYIMQQIGIFSKQFLPTIFDTSVFDENTTGAFQIKPPSKKSTLNPHQDAPVIDETKHNALFVWIPLIDTTVKNGTIYVLPKSHLWGNHQRSLNVPWVFEKRTKYLWKKMIPIEVKKGDILCWDSAMIHASSPNLSSEIRIAITTTLLPKNFKMVDYFIDKKTTNGMVEKYEVEKSFWENEDIMKRPPCPPNKFLGEEKWLFNKVNHFNMKQFTNQV